MKGGVAPEARDVFLSERSTDAIINKKSPIHEGNSGLNGGPRRAGEGSPGEQGRE